jgi:hypothetical protein
MKHLILAVALAAGCTLASSSPALAATRTYDCSKAGNANKAACKATAKAAPKAAKPAKAAKAPKAAPAKTATKAPPKAAPAKTAQAAPAAKPTMMQRVRGMFGGSSTAAAPATKAAAPRRTAAAAPASALDRNPAGAIAQCKDGTYSHSKVRNGACSRHGGVAKWS